MMVILRGKHEKFSILCLGTDVSLRKKWEKQLLEDNYLLLFPILTFSSNLILYLVWLVNFGNCNPTYFKGILLGKTTVQGQFDFWRMSFI